MSNFIPTDEQAQALDAKRTGDNLVIEAGAGTGKTSTLKLLGGDTTDKGLYVAYNKAIQVDAAKSFPANVNCRTSHSLAFGAVGRHFMPRIKGYQFLYANQVADILGIDRSFPLSEGREVSESQLARLAMGTVERFCQTADTEFRPGHVPMLPGTEEQSWDLARHVLPFAQEAWRDLAKPSGKLRFTHDMYIKLWALGWQEGKGITGRTPRIPASFIMVDEAQDSNPCLMGVLLAQDAQLIAVGDRAQAIYGWRGAVDAMGTFPAEHRIYLSQSFRFGQAIADEANTFLASLDTPLRLTGFEKIESNVAALDQPDALLCRTNAGVIQGALDTPADQRFAIVGDTKPLTQFAKAASDLMRGKRADWHPELGVFKRWDDVCAYADEDEGRDLRVMVNLVRDYGPEEIERVANSSVAENRADRILSTAHKAKGREWGTVKIAADFTPSEERVESGEGLSKDETMLAYVAVTRAQRTLDIGGLAWAR